jgi:hypothetical protein
MIHGVQYKMGLDILFERAVIYMQWGKVSLALIGLNVD